MVTTLAINPGSSSKKYALFQEGREVFSVRFEHTTEGYGKCVTVNGERNRCESIEAIAYAEGLLECLATAVKAKVIRDGEDITHVGIRVVAPHPFFTAHRRIDERFMQKLHELKHVVPLHIPYLIEEIAAARLALPHVELVGVSDSAFHADMPTHASLYSISDEDRELLHLYRYGYHGLSIASVLKEVSALHGTMPSRAIVIHAGSGVSVTAVKDGKCVDTSMGFAPASGLIMGSRGGDLDAVALLHLGRSKKFSYEEAETYLNTNTGFKGMLGTSDLRVVLDRAHRGEYKAQRALHAFVYHIHKTMHAYYGILGGVDAVILTATAAERNQEVRALITEAFSYAGCVLSEEENEALYERPGKISAEASSIAVYVIPTQEMREIAEEAKAI